MEERTLVKLGAAQSDRRNCLRAEGPRDSRWPWGALAFRVRVGGAFEERACLS